MIQEINTEEFSKLYPNTKWYMFTNTPYFYFNCRKSDIYTVKDYYIFTGIKDLIYCVFNNIIDIWSLYNDKLDYLIQIEPVEDSIIKINNKCLSINKFRLIEQPIEIWTNEYFCKYALEYNGLLIEHVKCLTNELCKSAVQQNGLALKFIKNKLFSRKNYHTPEICELAVRENGLALRYVVEKYKTYDLCLMAVEENPVSVKYISLKLTPMQYMYIYKHIVQIDGHMLQYIDNGYQTDEICELAIKEKSNSIQYIINKKYEFCKMSIENDGENLKYIDKQTEELCKLAVQNNGYAVQYIIFPNNYDMNEIYKLAVQQNPNSLQFIKSLHLTKDICEMALNKDGLTLYYIKQQTPEICETAVKQNGLAIYHVINKTYNLCKLAVQQNGLALKYIDVDYFTKNEIEELYMLALLQNKNSVSFFKNINEYENLVKLLKELNVYIMENNIKDVDI